MSLLRPLRPIHLVVLAALSALTAIIALCVKAYLVSTYVIPQPTGSEVITVTGPYSYDNSALDSIFVIGVLGAVVCLAVSWLWSHSPRHYTASR